jgi:adenylate kinase family enzyme
LHKRGRPDDSEEGIVKRFEEYEKAAKPILKEFKAAKILVCEIDGSRPVKQVHRDVLKAIKN